MDTIELRYFADVIDVIRDLNKRTCVTICCTGLERGPSYIVRDHRPRDMYDTMCLYVVSYRRKAVLRSRRATGDGIGLCGFNLESVLRSEPCVIRRIVMEQGDIGDEFLGHRGLDIKDVGQ